MKKQLLLFYYFEGDGFNNPIENFLCPVSSLGKAKEFARKNYIYFKDWHSIPDKWIVKEFAIDSIEYKIVIEYTEFDLKR